MADKNCSECGASIAVDAVKCPNCSTATATAAIDRTIATPPADLGATVAGPSRAAAGLPTDPLIGKELGGCKIETLLGTGAMGAVYRARQLRLDRVVAVKTILRQLAGESTLLERFEQEAKTIGRFNTPHVVQVHDVGREDGVHFLVMEYVNGGNLRTYAHKQPEERISVDDGIRFLRESCEGLREAQSLGVLHRDIKPDNLMLNDRGMLKIADFGIAKVLSQDINLTMTSELTGTPLYMSPEQCRGEELDFRTDMYSLGATFYYLLSGKPPAEGSSVFELIQTKTRLENLSLDRVLPVPGSAGPLSQVIERMTQLRPEDRYESYGELLDDLKRIHDGRKIAPAPARKRAAASAAAAEVREAEPAGGGMRWAIVGLLLVAIGGGVAWQMGVFATERDDNSGSGGEQVAGGFTPRVPLDGGAQPNTDAGGEAANVDVDPVPTVDDSPTQDDPSDPPLDDPPQPDPVQPDPPRVDPGDVLAASIAEFGDRITTLSGDFVREGPEAVETEASQLVTELVRKPAEFAETLAAARALDRDVKLAIGIRRDVQGLQPPVVDLGDLDEVANFVGTQSDKARVHPGATPAFSSWMSREIIADVATARTALATTASTRLSELWQKCQRLEREDDWDTLATSMRRLGDARVRLTEIFPGVDFTEAAPRNDVARLEQAIVDYETVVAFRREIQDAMTGLDKATLAGWVAGGGEAMTAKLGELRGRATGVLAVADVDTDLESLAAKVRFWDDYTGALSRALAGLTNAAVGTATRELETLAPHRVDKLPGYVAVSAARDKMRVAFDALVTRLEIDEARSAFERAGAELAGLTKLLPAAQQATAALADYERVCVALREATNGMVPVGADSVETEKGKPTDVAAFFLDRTEVSRAEFRAFAVSVRDAADAAAKQRLSHPIARLDGGELDKRDGHPIDQVSYDEAVAYLASQHKALPTYPEWYLAALGPASGPSIYPWGDAQPKAKEFNMTGGPQNVDTGGYARRFGTGTGAVHHLAGNVAEWLETGSDRKILIGGDYRLNGTVRRQRAAGKIVSARPSEHLAGVGFRGVIRPTEFLREHGCAVPID